MPNSSVTVCIVIVHYGLVETTKRCLNTLTQLKFQPKIVICNNDSPACADTLRQYIEELATLNAVVVQSDENRGFAAGCNLGIRVGEQLKVDYIWLLNNDTRVESTALEKLCKCAKKRSKAIIGSTVVDMNSPEVIQVAGGAAYNPWTTVINPAYAGEKASQLSSLATPRIDYIYGASLFIPLKFFQCAGLMDEDFFLYYEELDLCYRARKSGYELVWCPDSIVHHYGGAATGTKTGDVTSITKTAAFHESRSAILFTRKHYPQALMPVILARTLGKLLLLIVRRQWHLIAPTLKGVYKGLRTPKNNSG